MASTPSELFTVECRSGWRKLYQPLLDLTKLYGGTVLQVKEKFGGLRFYHACGGEPGDWLQAIVDAAEAASYHTCEECGEDGQDGWDEERKRPKYKATTSGKGWIRTLCQPCREKEHK